jgi:vacuolar protein sorting-associated protein 1
MAPQGETGEELPQDPPSRNVKSFGESNYGLSTQKLNEINNNLRQCGTEAVIPALPKIAAIGNQSAGKSQLIEAISRIKVPRATNTCTRCPIEIDLRRSESNEWKCYISLRFVHDDEYGRFGTFEFKQTENKDEIPLILRQAQLAILTPQQEPSVFYDLSEEQCENYPDANKFSSSTIVVKVIGADIDLTFVDLPGIISNIEVRSRCCHC